MEKNALPPFTGKGKINAWQLNLRTLFPVDSILKSRGYEIIKEGDCTDLLLKDLVGPGFPNYERLLNCFNNKNSRNQLRKYFWKGERPTNPMAIDLVNDENFNKDRDLFTKTFEWYIGEATVRYFDGFSFSYGVHLRHVKIDDTDSGDFDTLVVMRNLGLLYFECKTGDFNNKKIRKAIERAVLLNCELVIIVCFDLDETKLSYTLSTTMHPMHNSNSALVKIQVKSNQESTVYEWHNCYFLSANKDFIEQMKTIIRVNDAKRVYFDYSYSPDIYELSKMGYIAENVHATSLDT